MPPKPSATNSAQKDASELKYNIEIAEKDVNIRTLSEMVHR